MSRLHSRRSIALAAAVIVLLSSRAAHAQVGVDPGPPRERESLGKALNTGVWYDVANQAAAERKLQHWQAKLERDAERGDTAAVDHDMRRIDNLKYRITIDEWLIRWNSRRYPDFYPIRTDPVSCLAIAQATHPTPPPYPPQYLPSPVPTVAAPTMQITVINAEPSGPGVAFDIDGITHQALAGSRQDFAVALDSYITYDGGGSLGRRRYKLSPGRYEFRSTAEGWALYKLPDMP